MPGKRTFTSVFLFTFIVAACTGESPVEPRRSADPVMQRIADMGFDTVGAWRGDGYVVVEGDIRISDAVLTPQFTLSPSGNPLFNWHTTVTVPQTQTWGIPIKLTDVIADAASDPKAALWRDAIRWAMAAYHNVGLGVQYYEVTSDTPGQIEFFFGTIPGYNNCETAALAFWPGDPDRRILISSQFGTCFPAPNGLSWGMARRNMVHELGHTLGLRHTNINDDDTHTMGGVYIPGTNPDPSVGDLKSVMRGGGPQWVWTGWVYGDTISLRYLYPKVATATTNYGSPIYMVLEEPPFIVSSQGYTSSGVLIPGKAATWWYAAGGITSVTQTGLVTPLAVGSAQLAAQLDDKFINNTAHVTSITMSGPDSVALGDSATFTVSVNGPVGPYVLEWWAIGNNPVCSTQSTCTISGSQLQGWNQLKVVYRVGTDSYWLERKKSVVAY